MSHGLSAVGCECVLVYHSAKRSLRLNVSFRNIISSNVFVGTPPGPSAARRRGQTHGEESPAGTSLSAG